MRKINTYFDNKFSFSLSISLGKQNNLKCKNPTHNINKWLMILCEFGWHIAKEKLTRIES